VAALAGADLSASLPLLTSACWETLRLYSYAFGARSATADVDVPLVGGGAAGDTAPKVAHVRSGDNVLLVVQHHRDAAAFPDPDAFVANRFVAPDASSGAAIKFVLDGRDLTAGGPVRPFGGGKSMCPGRFIALNEMRIFAAVMLRHYSFESEAASTPPLPDMKGSGIGVLPPASPPLQVRLTSRRASHL
jgi:cytochrome P450